MHKKDPLQIGRLQTERHTLEMVAKYNIANNVYKNNGTN